MFNPKSVEHISVVPKMFEPLTLYTYINPLVCFHNRRDFNMRYEFFLVVLRTFIASVYNKMQTTSNNFVTN